MKTTKELKKEVMAVTGLTTRELSVKESMAGYSSAVHCEVKKAVPLSTIAKIIDSVKSVDRCEVTGEILEGGNTYTNTGYTHNIEIPEEIKSIIVEECAKINNGPAKALISDLQWSDNSFLVKIMFKNVIKRLAGWTENDIRDLIHANYGFYKTLTINI